MDLIRRLEALLFATRQPLSVSDLSSLVGEEEGAVRKALRQLVKQYSGDGTAMEIRRIGHRYRMALKSEYVELAMPVAEAEMSRSEIDALAYIAKHPGCFRGELRYVVGSDYKSVLQSLKKKGLIYTRRYRNSERVRLTKAFYERFEIKEQQGEGKDVS